jgi:hypothetical protein
MKLTPWYLVAIAPIAVAGCSGAMFGQCAVLAVTFCIFIGTLSLGRQAPGVGTASPVQPVAALETPEAVELPSRTP